VLHSPYIWALGRTYSGGKDGLPSPAVTGIGLTNESLTFGPRKGGVSILMVLVNYNRLLMGGNAGELGDNLSDCMTHNCISLVFPLDPVFSKERESIFTISLRMLIETNLSIFTSRVSWMKISSMFLGHNQTTIRSYPPMYRY